MQAQAAVVTSAWSAFADSLIQQVILLHTCSSTADVLQRPNRHLQMLQVIADSAARAHQAQPGFKGLPDLCAGGLAGLTANYFLDKLLVRLLVSQIVVPSMTSRLHAQLQANLRAIHIKHFWEQYSENLSQDAEHTETLLLTSLQVCMSSLAASLRL